MVGGEAGRNGWLGLLVLCDDAEGVSYLAIVGIIGVSLYSKVRTGKGLDAGPVGLVGAVEVGGEANGDESSRVEPRLNVDVGVSCSLKSRGCPTSRRSWVSGL